MTQLPIRNIRLPNHNAHSARGLVSSTHVSKGTQTAFVIGAIGSIVVDIANFGKPAIIIRLSWIAVTLGGVVDLKLTSS